MNTSLFSRRRVERFAQLIEEETEGRRDTPTAAGSDLEALVSLTRRISDLPMSVESHPEFREGLRAVLMATIEREGIGATAKPEAGADRESLRETLAAVAERRRARRRTKAFGAVVAGLAATALGLSGVSVASDTAMPGEALYTIKRQAERAQMALTGSDSKGRLYLDFARTRLNEADAVVGDPAAFGSTLNDMDGETREGVSLLVGAAIDRRDAASLDVVDAFVTDQLRGIDQLKAKVTGELATRLDASRRLIGRVTERSLAVRTLLPCSSAIASKQDDLGPVPVSECDAADPTTPSTSSTPSSTPKSTPSATTPSAGQATAPSGANAGGTGKPSPATTPLDGATLTGGPEDILGDLPR